ncbi:PepSY-associated TM helix domain-containing protein [Sphingomonas sp.]|uniref:PepSY-associated TM helix domain-containing protein n=1 Tax=Sphingomonas sp. TaxID=28214 RepID=UPI00262456EB|nr:PepSY-associated TM helix domain-containing protein [Sphingomonas sp.]
MERPAAAPAADARASAARQQPASRSRKKARSFWLKQLHTWHWVSAAVSLAGMLLFAITGITLNHAASIGAEPKVTQVEAMLPPPRLAELRGDHAAAAPLPPRVAEAVAAAVALDPAGRAAEWSDEDVYVAMPGPGQDAWVSIDRTTGAISAERTWRGWISYLNDLHKGRNTGDAWFWFIDVFAAVCIVFTLTGLLLLQLHARHRPSTWPLVATSLLVPLLLAVFLIH